MRTDGADGAWNVLGDDTRRMIFSRLAEKPRAVGELADELPISRPTVSQHLRVLKTAGLPAVSDGISGDAGWPLYLARYGALFGGES